MSNKSPDNELARRLKTRIDERSAHVGILGMGYVGLPLALAFAEAGFSTHAFDTDPAKLRQLEAGQSYLKHVQSSRIAAAVDAGRLFAQQDTAKLAEMDAAIICVPTPLTPQREPDMSYVIATTETIARHLQPGQMVALESTTYPGTTLDQVRPLLERGGLKSGRDFFLAYSPEREDPGRIDFQTATIPKIVSGDGPMAKDLAIALYGAVVREIVPVSDPSTAEAVKLTENIFRAVNIALVNELKVLYTRMGINIWDVIEAAKTKPFGYMPFYPGPGLGGHCVPIDPFYLTWKAREFGLSTRFIELAGEINHAMPQYVVDRLAEAMNDRQARALKGARVLLVGVAYKKNVDDTRESPAFRIWDLLAARGAIVEYYDPYVPILPTTRQHPHLAGRQSIDWTAAALSQFDAAIICTDHDGVEYATLANSDIIIADTRDALSKMHIQGERLILS